MNATIKLILLLSVAAGYAGDDLIEVWTIGKSAEDVFDGAPLHRVTSVAVSADGTVFVGDGGNTRILKFDERGRWLGGFGREGEGPGEFVSVSDIAISENRVYVLDGRLRRISMFDSSGTFDRSFLIKEMGADLSVRNGSVFLSFYSPFGSETLVKAYDTTGAALMSFGTPLPSTADANRSGEAGTIALTEDGTYYAFAYPYRIDRYDSEGRLKATVEVDDPAFEPPSAGDQKGEFQLGGALAAKIRGLAVIDRGTHVVQITYRDKPPQLQFVSEHGEVQRIVQLPDGHELAAVDGNHIYTFVHGTDDAVASVTMWRFARD